MKNISTFALKGSILYSETKNEILCFPNSYLVCEDRLCAGIFKELPDKFLGIQVMDYKDKLIIPGLVDLHLHAPQYAFRGLGMDMELLEWLNSNTFPEEAKYGDLDYADTAYSIFADEMASSATTRACIFGTVHVPATELLMGLIDKTGIKAFVGKVNMDRNTPDYLCESSYKKSIEDTRKWVADCKNKYKNVKPILTPRFIPSCSDELMAELAKLQKETYLPLQSHLGENKSEVEWVKELAPGAKHYADAYDRFGLFGGGCRTIMAHCVYPTKEEIKLMKEREVFIAHCAGSNMNISSGVAPVRTYLDCNMKMGLGSDVAGGFTASIFRAMSDAIQSSKMRNVLFDSSLKSLTIPEVFYLATKGGGEFFGKVGSFEKGYEFDAVVIDDENLYHPQYLTQLQRLERVIYLSDDRNIWEKYIGGIHVSKSINKRQIF